MNQFPIIRVVSKLLIPYIVLFAFYVQFHGDYGPGGGFQAGVVLASAIILYALVFGLDAARRVISPAAAERWMAVGVLIYAGTGVLSMVGGGNFLDYDHLDHPLPAAVLPHTQHLGIFLVELGVGVTVTAVMITLYYAFAARRGSTATRRVAGVGRTGVGGRPDVPGAAENPSTGAASDGSAVSSNGNASRGPAVASQGPAVASQGIVDA